jgi:hypothetical protein
MLRSLTLPVPYQGSRHFPEHAIAISLVGLGVGADGAAGVKSDDQGLIGAGVGAGALVSHAVHHRSRSI